MFTVVLIHQVLYGFASTVRFPLFLFWGGVSTWEVPVLQVAATGFPWPPPVNPESVHHRGK